MTDIATRLSHSKKPIPAAKDLGFGQYFTDHWFVAKYSEGKGWYSASVEPYGTIAMDPAASVLHYGQALFEGMKAFPQDDGSLALFRPEFNFNRMVEGAERLCLVPPPRELFMGGLRRLIEADARWVPRDEGCSLYIRPTLIGVEPFLGVRPAREILFYILLSPVGGYYGANNAPVKIWVEDKALRAAPGGLGHTKAGANYAASLQAALEAKKRGYSQVLWLDVAHAGIEEVGTMNAFFVFSDEIVTPALNGSILAGGTRDSVLRMLRADGKVKVSERLVTIGEVLTRHARGELLEAFGTGTAAVISPIGELFYRGEARVLNGGEWGLVSRDLYKRITDLQRGRAPDEFGWMKRVSEL
ncbi:MAG TPA: branched-chain amino acid aminotransferase [Bdellovibrionales bacterium]|nr:branched-chain amino acid aminotransferase [Bdellovibrionales bacterium]